MNTVFITSVDLGTGGQYKVQVVSIRNRAWKLTFPSFVLNKLVFSLNAFSAASCTV